MRERYLHRCREQSFAIRAYALSAVGIDVVSDHKLFAYNVVSTVCTDIVSGILQNRIRYHKISRRHFKVQMNIGVERGRGGWGARPPPQII